ncbi:hypothetical protein FNH22_13875 [Fulvivirga sp. M361]|uniref:hypothetical protein n=1 Tax=Fulvivirga sp. M361 TaxID=2594266 RepID=UPI00117A81A0|nr:hypothetical protein [Fulvivirga sp. M361]TRX58429.1 hypothetical protein FNH22_13875 [Fulvivirga sp. M361]
MDNIDEIKKNYAQFSTDKLLLIVKDIDSLRPELIPVLQSELIKRGETEATMKITEHLVNEKEKSDYLNSFDVEKFVQEQLDSGETIENIKLRLDDLGVNMHEILDQEQKSQELILDYITTKKEEGTSKENIEKDLKENFNVDAPTSQLLDAKLRRKGKMNLVVGYTLVITMSIFVVLALAAEARIGFGALILAGIGVWKISEGMKQRKKVE